MSIKFKVNYRKVVEAIVYILGKHHRKAKSIFILKCLYYADKYHLQQYACPITGDEFVKLKHGPCARAAYDILKRNELYIPEQILNSVNDAFSASNGRGTGDYDITYKAIREANLSVFSDSDLECLDKAIDFCSSYTDDFALSEESHKEEAWKQAEDKGIMSYELMIDKNTTNRKEILEYLNESSRSLCL